jgi:hypothetical protein
VGEVTNRKRARIRLQRVFQRKFIRFERSPDSLMCADDRADALPGIFVPSVYQRDRALLCWPAPRELNDPDGYSCARPEICRQERQDARQRIELCAGDRSPSSSPQASLNSRKKSSAATGRSRWDHGLTVAEMKRCH